MLTVRPLCSASRLYVLIRFWLPLLFLLFFLLDTSEASKTFGNITISSESPLPGVSKHGYIEYGFSVSNISPTDYHQVTLVFPDTKYSSRYGHYMQRLQRSQVIAPSSTARMSIFCPNLPIYGRNITVYIDGERQADHIVFSPISHGGSPYNPRFPVCILLTRGVPDVFEKTASFSIDKSIEIKTKAIPTPTGSHTSKKQKFYKFFRAETPVTEWSPHWLSYSRYDCIVLGAEDVGLVPPAVLTALWHYTECGGIVVVLDKITIPDPWTDFYVEEGGIPHYNVGFGQCYLYHDVSESELDQFWKQVNTSWTRTTQALALIKSPRQANDLLPVVAELSISIRGFSLLLLSFVIIIGPLNIFILSRKKRRIWLLWTVPAISIAITSSVIVYSFLSEGWRGTVRAKTLTILDQKNHRATTIGWSAYYSPLTPRNGLHFDYNTELTLQCSGMRTVRHHELDWNDGQNLSQGWMVARVPSHFIVRKSDVRRERIIFKAPKPGSATMVNGLGAYIKHIYVVDHRGLCYQADNIKVGEKRTLKESTRLSGSPPSRSTLRTFFTSEQKGKGADSKYWLQNIEKMEQTPREYLHPGTYIAVINDSPFVEKALQHTKTSNLQAVIYGILE